MNTLKKIVASSVVVTTVMSLVVAVAPVKAAASAGSLIKMSGNSSVYYLGADSKRYVFPNEATYKSWYSDFSQVQVIPQAELESYMIGGNVTMRPGTKLVKITTNPKVYAVEPGGSLVAIPDETTAKTLYGADWAKRVVDVPDAFFTNYHDSGKTVSANKYPAGSLVKFSASSPDVYYINADGTASKVASEAAFNANRFQFANVVDGSAVAMPTTTTDITGVISNISDTSSGAGGNPAAGTGLTVALAGTTAASASVIAGQALANLASFNLTASSDGAVKVTSVKLKRTGISQDATLKNVYLYDGATRLTDAAAVASGQITFTNASGIISIDKGATKTLTVKSDILSGSTPVGETLGVALNAAADVVTDGASVTGSFPATGNLMSVVQGTNLATVAVGAATPASATVNPGDTGIKVWGSTLTVSNHDTNLKYLKLREIGSINSADLKDFTLFVNGAQVAGPVQMSTDYYVTFDLGNAPVKLVTGNRTVEVRATVVDGSSKTYSFALRQPVDIVVEDVEYSVAITATGTGSNATTGTQNVAQGTLSVSKKSDSASGNITKDTTGASLAKYTVTAFGEPTKIETITFGFISSDVTVGLLRNGKVMANGSQVGSTANLATASTTGTTYTINYTVKPGTPVTFELVADIFDADGTNNITDNDTLQGVMMAGSANAQAQTSLNTISVPTTNVLANTITVKTGTITVAKTTSYGAQTVVTPQSVDYKLGSYSVSGNSSEDVTLNTFTVDFASTSGATFIASAIHDVYVKYGNQQTVTKANVSATGNTYSINYTLPKNGNLTVEVYGHIDSVTSNDAMKSKLTVSGTTVNSASSVSAGPIDGQVITSGAGSLTVSALNTDATVKARIVTGNSTQDVEKVKFVATNDAFTVSEVNATVVDSTNIVSAVITDGVSTSSGSISGTNITFSGLNFNVPAGSAGKVFTIRYTLDGVGAGAGSTGANLQTTVTGYKATGSQGNNADATVSIAGNNIYVYKTIPTIALTTLPNTVLADGTQTIAKFTVTSDAQGAIDWYQLKLNVSSSTGLNVTNFKLLDSSNNQIGATVAGATGGVVTFGTGAAQTVSGSETYTVKATVAGTDTGRSVSTTIDQDAAFVASTNAAAAGLSGSTFIWSDQSANAHATSTADWAGSFLLKNLPTDSQTMSR